MSVESLTVDELVRIHEKMKAKEAELQAELDGIEEQRNLVRKTILDIMNERNEESIRTESGTVTRTLKERIWTNDWAPLHQFILEHGAVDLLEKRIQQTNMRQWMEDHPNDYPPGINIDREYTITIRKPKTK